MGNLSALLPEGFTHLADAPYPLTNAIESGLTVLGWEDNLDEDEQPPKRIMDDPKKLKQHFAWVKRKREAEMDPKGSIRDQPIEDPVDNDVSLIEG